MENNNEMKINKLPAKTWYWLRMCMMKGIDHVGKDIKCRL